MAVALGHELTLDAEGVSAPMEELDAPPCGVHRWAEPERSPLASRAHGGRAAQRARGGGQRTPSGPTRITRQTIRGKEGGVYYVLAPGPSLMLAPALRVDRALNLARGTPGPARGVRAGLERAGRRARGRCLRARARRHRPAGSRRGPRPGLRARPAVPLLWLPVLSGDAGRARPGARFLGSCSSRRWTHAQRLARRGCCSPTLPWLHQKFLPVWRVLSPRAVGAACVRWCRSRGSWLGSCCRRPRPST